jgi:hypothetical protein
MAVTFGVTTEALRRGPLGAVSPITALSPALSALLGVALLGERLGWHAAVGVGTAPAGWKWPMADLLADTPWWDRWLPDLYELLGRDLRGEPDEWGGPGEPIVDRRGYGDLLTYLFPPVGDVTWRFADYPREASKQARQGTQDGIAPSVHARVWEPVLRHVVKALRALEETSAAGTDPQLRLEAEARITGSWVLVLGNLLGQQQTAPPPKPIG